MRDRTWLEEAVLLGSIVKWAVLATLAGAAAGIGSGLFLKGVAYGTESTAALALPYRLVLLPAAGWLTAWLIHRFAPEAAGHGTEAVITAVHRRQGAIDPKVVPVKALATIVSLTGGGSAGKEGPCAQVGSGLAALIARVLRLGPDDRRRLVICGISAGFTAVFGTPVGGAIFGVEVLFGGAIAYEVLFPSMVAGFTAYQTVQWFRVEALQVPALAVPNLTEPLFVKAIVLGALFGLIARLFIEAMERIHRLFERLPVSPPLRAAAGGAVLAVLALVAGSEYLGLGTDMLDRALAGGAVAALAFAWKILFTSVTLGSGFSGGVLMPVFFVGASAGSVLAPLFGIDSVVGAAVGMMAVLAGATNTPIASAVIGLELFGPGIGLYLAAACIASFAVAGHRSIYPSQVLKVRKSPALAIPLGRPAAEVGPVRLAPGTLRPVARLLRRVRYQPRQRPGEGRPAHRA
ncbi:MAG: chloride channel protein [Firmicutes bacterium]|nr:chloride channel protein [Bacillota bacterium]